MEGGDEVKVESSVELAVEKPSEPSPNQLSMSAENANKPAEKTKAEEEPKSIFNYGGFGKKTGGFGSNSNPAKPAPPVLEEKKSAFGGGSAFGSGGSAFGGGYSMGA